MLRQPRECRPETTVIFPECFPIVPSLRSSQELLLHLSLPESKVLFAAETEYRPSIKYIRPMGRLDYTLRL